MDNWQPLTCSEYCNRELEKHKQQQEMSSIGSNSTWATVKIEESGLDLFSFLFLFLFSIFRTTKVRVDQSCCHISHNLMA